MPDLPTTPTDLFIPLEAPPRWLSAREAKPPQRFVAADDRLTADAAFLLVSQGTGIVWQGDYHNARQLLQALARRIDKRRRRRRQGDRARRDLPRLPAGAGAARPAAVAARRPGQRRARAAGAGAGRRLRPRRGVRRGSWRLRPAADRSSGVHQRPRMAPQRRADRGARAAPASIPITACFRPHGRTTSTSWLRSRLPEAAKDGVAFDLGTGSGVLAAVLAQRVRRVVATDNSPRAIACARENFAALGLADRIAVEAADLFPESRAALIVCNPPWLPGKADTSLEAAVYDPDSRMLRGFLSGLADHLLQGGEGWLVLSDLAELLGLRSREQLLGLIADAGLVVLGRHDARPTHGKAADASDPLHFARGRETVSVWRLGK